ASQDQKHPSPSFPPATQGRGAIQAGSSGISALSSREMQSFSHSLRFFRRLIDSSSAWVSAIRRSISASRLRCSSLRAGARWLISERLKVSTPPAYTAAAAAVIAGAAATMGRSMSAALPPPVALREPFSRHASGVDAKRGLHLRHQVGQAIADYGMIV